MRSFKPTRLILACVSILMLSLPVSAQSKFAPAVVVNDKVVTNFEVEQRVKLLQLLRQPGNLEEEALNGLIDDRLRLQTAGQLGISVPEEDIEAGMEEFVSRADLTVEQFGQLLAGNGIEMQTFRDFVIAGLAWRSVIRERFTQRVNITESEIDRAIALSSNQSGVRVLLSEIILPAPPGQEASARRRAEQISQMTSLGAFSSAAQSSSASASRGRGGRIDWMPIGNLPAPIRAQILTLSPGEVTDPIEIPNAIALFQLRAIEETDTPDEQAISVEYATYFIAGGQTEKAQSQATNIRNQIDTCDDLYGIAKGQPEERLQRETLPVAEVPQDIALELAKLDDNEVSTALTRSNGQTLMLLMLCGRVTEQTVDVSREDIRARLTNQRFSSYADGLLADLRAEAFISYP
ncbi:peptidylprolyl isomerase [Pseudohalocynthiibacter aestuariivivens]|jgi:peptidyl-prolyl cis-trans isomerase SurA|uniref:Parvulin-like PPIase n=1 Tax=Pseudohalocynthiibacter aestuariivivens TaxID=1591409 RepID=A0ABV5JIL2_9RHOB|nr:MULTISPECIES: peptidylprolyl isomerase [Pseudohalocynthiibacter]MBS9716536.1 peptidylprolyl isomerase [Pseudohalocynthiibacter aestuariivivens]MCK0101605.1 peptidylprolyl isomerase [Pseudohalocynthiibacter sp. F2068]